MEATKTIFDLRPGTLCRFKKPPPIPQCPNNGPMKYSRPLNLVCLYVKTIYRPFSMEDFYDYLFLDSNGKVVQTSSCFSMIGWSRFHKMEIWKNGNWERFCLNN